MSLAMEGHRRRTGVLRLFLLLAVFCVAVLLWEPLWADDESLLSTGGVGPWSAPVQVCTYHLPM